MSMKNSNETIGNRARDLPACSAVPQSTAPRLVPLISILIKNNIWGTGFLGHKLYKNVVNEDLHYNFYMKMGAIQNKVSFILHVGRVYTCYLSRVSTRYMD